MKIHKGVESFQRLSKAVVTTGTFDGVHLGHAKMLNKLVEIGQANTSETVLMTFFPHPRIVLFPDHDLKLINDIDENIELFKNYNIDHLIIQNFDKEFSRLTSLDYIRDILIKKIGLKNLVIGFNHHFGRNREGSLKNLNEYADLYDFDIHQVDSYSIDKKSVSSTKIRNAINLGDVQLVNSYLGYSFTFSGIVSKGKGRGKSMGFPTANIILENKNKIIPKFGVYAVNIIYNQIRYKGMLNIGMNPTFNNPECSIEVHIFDFNKEIYGSKLSIELVDRIRNEKKFNNPDELKNQLAIDKIASLNIL
ncbi:MAG: riboflavin biosynthesis protein RibF [Flavobacteriales bacterium]|nr:riboflavin biosynthesis protein RibF [Flavobacteriales bacterium]|tara:strand:- start:6281 stop:7201 length:921 start_codon:yes stop_codon:yes gene_type:complete